MKLKEIRKQLGLTQPEASAILSIPFRTYCRYENEKLYEGTFKYNQMLTILNDYASKAVLSLDLIKNVVSSVCENMVLAHFSFLEVTLKTKQEVIAISI